MCSVSFHGKSFLAEKIAPRFYSLYFLGDLVVILHDFIEGHCLSHAWRPGAAEA